MMNYKKSKPVQIPSENLIVDPRSETSIRGKNYIATGDKTTVKGTGKARKQNYFTIWLWSSIKIKIKGSWLTSNGKWT